MTHSRPTVLFVHPACTGGAAVSLTQLIQCLAPHFRCVAVVGAGCEGARGMLAKVADEVIVGPTLARLDHVAWRWASPRHPYVTGQILRDALRLPASLRWYQAMLREVHPEIVYCNTLPAVPYGAAARLAGIRTVLHVREPIARGHVGLRWVALRRVISSHFDHVVFISPLEQAALAVEVPQSVVYNWVDTEVWKPGPNPTDTGLPRLLYVGGLDPIKGSDVLLNALHILRQRGVRCRCTLLGVLPSTGSHPWLRKSLFCLGWRTGRHRLEAAANGDLGSVLEVKAFVPSPVEEFARADIVVFPALVDHFARPLVEAGAMGLPSVASDLPGPRLVLQPEQTGLVFPPGDATAFADMLERLIHSPDLRRRLGESARQRVVSLFSSDNHRAILEVLESLSK